MGDSARKTKKEKVQEEREEKEAKLKAICKGWLGYSAASVIVTPTYYVITNINNGNLDERYKEFYKYLVWIFETSSDGKLKSSEFKRRLRVVFNGKLRNTHEECRIDSIFLDMALVMLCYYYMRDYKINSEQAGKFTTFFSKILEGAENIPQGTQLALPPNRELNLKSFTGAQLHEKVSLFIEACGYFVNESEKLIKFLGEPTEHLDKEAAKLCEKLNYTGKLDFKQIQVGHLLTLLRLVWSEHLSPIGIGLGKPMFAFKIMAGLAWLFLCCTGISSSALDGHMRRLFTGLLVPFVHGCVMVWMSFHILYGMEESFDLSGNAGAAVTQLIAITLIPKRIKALDPSLLYEPLSMVISGVFLPLAVPSIRPSWIQLKDFAKYLWSFVPAIVHAFINPKKPNYDYILTLQLLQFAPVMWDMVWSHVELGIGLYKEGSNIITAHTFDKSRYYLFNMKNIYSEKLRTKLSTCLASISYRGTGGETWTVPHKEDFDKNQVQIEIERLISICADSGLPFFGKFVVLWKADSRGSTKTISEIVTPVRNTIGLVGVFQLLFILFMVAFSSDPIPASARIKVVQLEDLVKVIKNHKMSPFEVKFYTQHTLGYNPTGIRYLDMTWASVPGFAEYYKIIPYGHVLEHIPGLNKFLPEQQVNNTEIKQHLVSLKDKTADNQDIPYKHLLSASFQNWPQFLEAFGEVYTDIKDVTNSTGYQMDERASMITTMPITFFSKLPFLKIADYYQMLPDKIKTGTEDMVGQVAMSLIMGKIFVLYNIISLYGYLDKIQKKEARDNKSKESMLFKYANKVAKFEQNGKLYIFSEKFLEPFIWHVISVLKWRLERFAGLFLMICIFAARKYYDSIPETLSTTTNKQIQTLLADTLIQLENFKATDFKKADVEKTKRVVKNIHVVEFLNKYGNDPKSWRPDALNSEWHKAIRKYITDP